MPHAPNGIWYEAVGDGPPVVLLHAGVVDGRIWTPVVPLLADSFRLVVYDQRGYGRSQPWDGPYSPVDDLAGVMDDAGVERASLVGLSRGGRIALEAALERPERVDALVLVASGLGGHPLRIDATPEQEQRWAELEAVGDVEKLAEADLEIWAPLGADPALRALFHENAVASNTHDPAVESSPPQAERLGEVGVRTLVVTAGRDVPAMDEIGDALERGIPGARRARLDDADHMVPWRAPRELAELLLDFLA